MFSGIYRENPARIAEKYFEVVLCLNAVLLYNMPAPSTVHFGVDANEVTADRKLRRVH